jgi:hypothetical protein
MECTVSSLRLDAVTCDYNVTQIIIFRVKILSFNDCVMVFRDHIAQTSDLLIVGLECQPAYLNVH